MKKLFMLFLLSFNLSHAAERCAQKKDKIVCNNAGKNYLIDISNFGGSSIEMTSQGETTSFRSQFANYIYSFKINFTNNQFVINDFYYESYYKFDYDNKKLLCVLNKDIHLDKDQSVVESLFDSFTEKNTENCKTAYNPSRTIAEIHSFLINDFDFKEEANYHYDKISDPVRYETYLKKYPISASNNSMYQDIADILVKAGLYKESVVINIALVNFNNKNVEAIQGLLKAYKELNQPQETQKLIKKFNLKTGE